MIYTFTYAFIHANSDYICFNVNHPLPYRRVVVAHTRALQRFPQGPLHEELVVGADRQIQRSERVGAVPQGPLRVGGPPHRLRVRGHRKPTPGGRRQMLGEGFQRRGVDLM